MRVGAIEDRHLPVGQSRPFGQTGLDLVGDPAGFVRLAGGGDQCDSFAADTIGAKCLTLPIDVLRNDGVRRR